ncbi:hypothetical protein JOE31_001300 [Arthrobacter sp. PvP023]|nr:hypothetical protein [Arthrobacter sp. PvP023]
MVWRHSPHVAQARTEPAGRVALLHLDAIQPVALEGQMQTQVESFLANLRTQRLVEAGTKTSQ